MSDCARDYKTIQAQLKLLNSRINEACILRSALTLELQSKCPHKESFPLAVVFKRCKLCGKLLN